ncbi:formylglycine-generating enzyme family protein [Spirochaetota bacterium]
MGKRHVFKIIFVIAIIVQISACGPPANGNLSVGFKKCGDLKIPADMKCIPGGPFTRGSNDVSIDEDTWRKIRDEGPVMKIILSTFFIDTYEVTYSDYMKCYKAGECTKAGPNYRGYDNPRQPMLGLSWYQARKYCNWKNKRLPTEAEWEKAARGPNGELYPWGNKRADCKRSIIKERGKKGCGTGKTWDVGSRPAYRYGLYDMSGNSWEWVNDWYSPNYTKCGKNCSGKNPRGPCNGNDKCPGHKQKVLKGGSWWWDYRYARASNRRSHFAKNKPYHHYGFRCAKTP